MEKISRPLAVILLITAALAAQEQHVGIIAGSVFRESGLSLPAAVVTVTSVSQPGEKRGRKQKPWKVTTDDRGEFAIRVPAGAMRYDVRVEAKGYEPEEKEVQVEWDQRVEVFFRLRSATEAK